MRSFSQAELGYAYALARRIDEALPLLERGVAEAASSLHAVHSVAVCWLGEAYLLAGRVQDAQALAVRALSPARQRKELGVEAWLLRLLGEIAVHADQPEAEQAQNYYQQALARAKELGMRPLEAHCHLGLGTLHQKVGRDHEAKFELAMAAEMYRAMEMMFWLGKAETALTQAGAA